MLTRLRVQGFKNLVDVDVRFGPFTCVAGPNGVGKSNLFDAILFLSALSDRSITEAAASVRQETRGADALGIFTSAGPSAAPEMVLDAEMVLPRTATDDLDQAATATSTFVRYRVVLRRREGTDKEPARFELVNERLDYFRKEKTRPALGFKPSWEWLDSVLVAGRSAPYLSTEQEAGGPVIKIHDDRRGQGRNRRVAAGGLPRTVLSTLNAESPTALVVRREMRSWRLFHPEPARLREPNEFNDRAEIGRDGFGLPATVQRLIHSSNDGGVGVRNRLRNRLMELINDVKDVTVDRDEKRELLTLFATGADGYAHRARDLSDGTLRFLALATLELDARWQGTLCMEEPENGIHPARVPAMIDLLKDLSVQVDAQVDDDNPLRQVIVNTHSPQVVGLVPEGSLLVACRDSATGGVRYAPLSGTWRARETEPVDLSEVIALLNAMPVSVRAAIKESKDKSDLVAGRKDVSQYLFAFADDAR